MAREMKDSGIEWIGEIPDNWEISRIKYVAEFEPKCNMDELEDDSIITYLPMECLKNGYFEKRELSLKDVPASLTRFQENDIVMAKVTPCFENGNIAIMQNLQSGFGVGSSELFVLRCKKINIHYLFWWLQNMGFVSKACSTMTGTGGLKRISPNFVRNCAMHIPPETEQKCISNFLKVQCAKLDNIIAKTRASIDEYKKLKQAVITQAVTKGVRGDREMKDSGIEWIGEIPADWEVVKMKNLGKCRNGLTYSPDNLVSKEEGTLVLRSSNIKDGKLSFVDNVYVNSEIKDDLMVKAGDILICSRNGSRALIGKNALIPEDLNASFGAFMMIFRCQAPKYVQMILNSAVFSYYLGTFLTSTINQLTADNFNKMKIVYCSDKFEQKEITDYLDKKCAEIDTLITKKEQIIVELENYKKSVIYEYVTGKREVPETWV